MTGIVGGTASKPTIDGMLDSLYREDWYSLERRSSDAFGLGVAHHGRKDPQSGTIHCGDRVLGAIYGVVSNAAALPWTSAELLRGVVDSPDAVLPKLEGPFLIAAMDRETGTIRVATDKAGSRPCYYTDGDGFHFGSELKPLLEGVSSPTVDRQAVSDLLLLGTVIGEKTILEDANTLPPATYLTYADGTVETTRYWTPEAREDRGEEYVRGWIRRFEDAMDDLIGTVDGPTGLWLSGGLDSRVAGATLRRLDADFETLTYDNGLQGDNEVAPRVADRLGVRHRQITDGVGSPDEFVESIERCVDCNDAMQSWAYVPALSFMFHGLADTADVVMEGGTFLGEDVWSYYLENDVPPEETLYRKRKQLSAERVASIVPAIDDPRRSLRAEAARTSGDDDARRSCDAMRRFYSYLHRRSNVIQRSQVGTRSISDGAVLSHAVDMPAELRMQTVPGTDGRVPLGVPPIKLHVTRALDMGLDEIEYERTGVAPARSYWLHAAGFVGKQLANRFTDDSPGPYVARYRRNERIRSFIDGLVDDARDRPFFDGDELLELREQLSAGESANLTPLAAVVGLELWLQRHVDPLERSAASQSVPASTR